MVETENGAPTNVGDLSDTSKVSPRYFEVKLSLESPSCLTLTSAFYLTMGREGEGQMPGCYLAYISAQILVGTAQAVGGGNFKTSWG